MQRQKGSITIFALLSMLLVMATLFSLLEIARYQSMKGLAALQTEVALESAFANYNSFLWENYHLLVCQIQEVEAELEKAGDSRLKGWGNRSNFLLFQSKDAEITTHTRVSDGNGTAYIQAISHYMEECLLYETAKQMYNQYEALKQIKETTEMDLSNIERALEEMEKVADSEPKSIGSSKQQKSYDFNPLEEFQKLQKNGVLELVLENTEELSNEELVLGNVLSHRERKIGNGKIEEVNWLDKVWLQQYMLAYLSHYSSQKENRSLSYELEYVIGGKESDIANLKIVVGELLTIREMANFLYLTSDVEKVGQAQALAMALAGVTANPFVIDVVKVGILTAWAFGESVLDVRALLQNKKIPLLKNKELWTLELAHIGEVAKGYWMAKEASHGLSYENYIGILLLFQSEELLAMRSMDVQEAAMRKYCGDTTIGLDEMIIQIEARITYGYHPVFSNIQESTRKKWNYKIVCEEAYGYD